MAKELHCGEIMHGCAEVIRGETVEEVMQKGAKHAKAAHGVEQMDEETKKKVQAAIRDA